MAKVDFRILSPAEWHALERELWMVLRSMKREGQLIEFIRSLCTSSEILMFTRRIRIAKLLLQGFGYLEIRQQLGVGLSTIWTVEQWLQKSCSDYRNIFEKLSTRATEKNHMHNRIYENDPLSFAALRRKYPLHFLLFNLAR